MSAEETALCDAVHEWYERDKDAFPPDVKAVMVALIQSNSERTLRAYLQLRDNRSPAPERAYLCEHANENPHRCPCDANCYCKSHTCEARVCHEGRNL